jgi:hypothetical protein
VSHDGSSRLVVRAPVNEIFDLQGDGGGFDEFLERDRRR